MTLDRLMIAWYAFCPAVGPLEKLASSAHCPKAIENHEDWFSELARKWTVASMRTFPVGRIPAHAWLSPTAPAAFVPTSRPCSPGARNASTEGSERVGW